MNFTAYKPIHLDEPKALKLNLLIVRNHRKTSTCDYYGINQVNNNNNNKTLWKRQDIPKGCF